MNTIAIIDDYFNDSLYNSLSKHRIKKYRLYNHEIIGDQQCLISGISHGSICAAVFSEYAPDCNLIFIGLLENESRQIDSEALLIAFNWCIEHCVKLICTSIGSAAPSNLTQMAVAVEQLCMQGILVVAACNNNNTITFPASLPSVIGVRSDHCGIVPIGCYAYQEKPPDGINIVVSLPDLETLKFIEERYQTVVYPSNSFAAPYIAAKVCTLIGKDSEVIYESIKSASYELPQNAFPESYYRQMIVDFSDIRNIDVPILCIVHHRNPNNYLHEMMLFGKKLMEHFLSDSYWYIMAGNDIETDICKHQYNLYGNENYSSVFLLQNLTLIYNMSKPDVILLLLYPEQASFLVKRGLIDVLLEMESTGSLEDPNRPIGYCVKEPLIQAYYDCSMSDKEIYRLFCRIKELLS